MLSLMRYAISDSLFDFALQYFLRRPIYNRSSHGVAFLILFPLRLPQIQLHRIFQTQIQSITN